MIELSQLFLNEITKRQKEFCQQIDTPHIFFASTEKTRNSDVYYPFRQESSFLYLTAFPESDAIAIFEPNGTYTLFVKPKDQKKELWSGSLYGEKEAKEVFKAHKVYSIEKFNEKFSEIIADSPIILNNQQHLPKLKNLTQRTSINKECITQMRLIKSPWEIEQMKHASNISSNAHIEMMKQRLNFQYEYQFEACFRHQTMKEGALEMAYPAIVAGGQNACTLHYNNNNAKIKNNNLVLIDAGCEWQNYAADITRTFPLREEFTTAQKAIYQIVLDTQQRCIDAVSNQISIQEIHQLACHQITIGLIDLDLLKGSVNENIEKKTYSNFFPHGIGHQLGLDVHDITTIEASKNNLKTGMTLTIEPGIYLQPNDASIPKEFRGIGIRIEDNILVNGSSNENLTTAPKLINEIEL